MRKSEQVDVDWARAAYERKSHVFHLPTGLVGQLWGLDVEYGPHDPTSSTRAVLKVREGERTHELHAVVENFRELTGEELALWRVLVEAVSGATKELAVYAASQGVGRKSFEELAAAVFRAQVRALGRTV